ncbi:DNA-3-methyladenine glycosylase [Antrihabitans cavernicola]|uniref:Putative 3-methyladenine DNA glycosylase n=1 Tax=Antrihabitans cavernicola TaxID=2495913 RepID=A0A5A7S867_9NOCA|nr:DNA-3-methyladenine glycosylase [Spelaeibacter cavernicola]KAA0021117.1 DNA-3-methyladenine glycosylase [Spelaeibacter cavernicola]
MSVAELADADPPSAARRILGATLRARGVAVRVVEVEAYGSDPAGPWPDSAAHSFPGRTPRNSVMFGVAGSLYVYLSYGMHVCANVTCGPDGTAGAVLIRAGEVIEGIDEATARRPTARRVHDLARGPGNLGKALGITLSDYGSHLFDPAADVTLTLGSDVEYRTGPRVGVSTEADRPWRFWMPNTAAVSAYRRSPRAPGPADAGRSMP